MDDKSSRNNSQSKEPRDAARRVPAIVDGGDVANYSLVASNAVAPLNGHINNDKAKRAAQLGFLNFAPSFAHKKIVDCNSNLPQQHHREVAPNVEKAEMARRAAKQQKKWNKRLKILFCCLGYKKNKDSIADVASIFAEFYADLKVPSSDLAAGFVLLSKYQAAQMEWIVKHGGRSDQRDERAAPAVEQYLSGIPIKSDTKFLDLSTADDSHLINHLIYYLNYSLAIFGWPMHLVDDPCLLCCIYPYLRATPCCGWRRARARPQCSAKSCDSAGAMGEQTAHDSKDETADSSANQAAQQVELPGCQETDKLTGRESTTSPQPMQRSSSPEASSAATKATNTTTTTTTTATTPVGKLADDCDIPIILEDNCCGCNVAAAERRLASHNYEIIYVSYKVNVNVVPFLVAADHSKQAIVVAIRGSMSLSDMVTDMNGQIDKVPLADCPDDWLCHRGITRAAMYVKLTLEQERIIERAQSCRPDLGSKDYTLVLCGHSLGAGAAAILGVLMRPQYPTLKAYLYSPPGGILSMPVVEYTKEFAIGVILGNDTVPRLGIAQLERLRYQTLLSIKSAQKSTSKILAKALCPSFCFGDNEVEYDPAQSLDLLHGTEGRAFEFCGTVIPFQAQPQVLYVPGRLIHVVKDYSFQAPPKKLRAANRTSGLWNGPIYQAVWTDNAIYDRVFISEGMFFDHLPNKLMQAMKMLFSKTLPDRRESRSPSSVTVGQPVNLAQREQQSKQLDAPFCPNEASNFRNEIQINKLAQTNATDLRGLKASETDGDDHSNADEYEFGREDDDDNNNNNSNNNNNNNRFNGNDQSNCKAMPDRNYIDRGLLQQDCQLSIKQQIARGRHNDDLPSTELPLNQTIAATNNKINLDENGNEQCS